MLPFPSALVDAIPSFAQSHNATLLATITPKTLDAPFYYTERHSLLSFISDRNLSLSLPIIAYWAYSTLFHWLDESKFSYFEARRIHPPAEVASRNRATLWQVIRAVILQQVIQTIVGLLLLDSDDDFINEMQVDHLTAMARITSRTADLVFLLAGQNVGRSLLEAYGAKIVWFMYWWGIPAIQLFVGFCIIDTWQYWLHRTMHVYPTLYRMFHSHHHRLYVPFAFGALYNHPLEGLCLDTIGAGLAHMVTYMNIRQAILLFTVSTLKTVDDHCGYRLWWDPCQLFFANNADYHDIHHQQFGIKANFSQPFFIAWDVVLGTRMTRAQAEARRHKNQQPAKLE